LAGCDPGNLSPRNVDHPHPGLFADHYTDSDQYQHTYKMAHPYTTAYQHALAYPDPDCDEYTHYHTDSH
jgi:hypothetical protein